MSPASGVLIPDIHCQDLPKAIEFIQRKSTMKKRNRISSCHVLLTVLAAFAILAGCEVEPPSQVDFPNPPPEAVQEFQRIHEAQKGGRDPFAHSAVAPASDVADVELAADKQDQIWQAEHVTFEIEECFGPRFWAAIKSADTSAMTSLMLPDFSGHATLSPTLSGQLSLGAVSFWKATAQPDKVTVSSEEFAQQLRTLLCDISDHRRTEFRVLQIAGVTLNPGAALQNAGEDSPQPTDPTTSTAMETLMTNRWLCRIYLASDGEDAQGRLVHSSSRHDVVFEVENDDALKLGASLVSWSMVDLSAEICAHPLFREVTSEVGLHNTGIDDNWDLPARRVQQYRFQIAVEDFDLDGWLDIAVAETHRSRLFRWSPEFSKFLQVTEISGIVPLHAAKGMPISLAGFFDFDNDGDPDLLLGNRLYQNNGGTSFVDVTANSGLRFLRQAMGVQFADYDCDGAVDIYVVYQSSSDSTNGSRTSSLIGGDSDGEDNQLWRNVGNGRFRNVTASTHTGAGHRNTLAATWFFHNDDQYPDLYAANDFSGNSLLQNTGTGTFEDVSETTGTSDFATSIGVVAGDVDNDGRTDLYVANVFSKTGRRIIGHVREEDYPDGIFHQIQGACAGNRLYQRVDSETKYDESAESKGIHDVGWACAPAMADFNNDGLLDIYSSAGLLSFERHEPDGGTCLWRAVVSRPLDRISELPARGALDDAAGEFWITNPFQIPQQGKNLSAYENNRLFMNIDGHSFVDTSYGSMANIDADSRSVVAADFNRDGRPDLLVGSVGGGPLRLFMNQLSDDTSGGVVGVSLTGTQSNRTAIGCRIEAHIGDQKVVRDTFYQNGCMGHGPPDRLIGLGKAKKIDLLKIRWSTGIWQQFKDIPANSRVMITEGSDQPVIKPLSEALQ